MKYPRVLVVVMGRINAADTSNNGLLLRNLFGKFPRENLAQIYSSGDVGDKGFFVDYYRLSRRDRRLGYLFYRMKSVFQGEMTNADVYPAASVVSKRKASLIRSLGKRLLIDTGLYELVFRPRLSRKMLAWAENFRPDIIFAQGYSLAFAWLPLMLSRRFKLPIAYYPTDDWSNVYYTPELGYKGILPKITRHIVIEVARKLVETASVCIAFNRFMREEYLKRFGCEFTVLMHGDDLARFDSIPPRKLTEQDAYWIVCTGDFDRHRLPLLEDLDQACEILNEKGIKTRAMVFPVVRLNNAASQVYKFHFVQFSDCPSHDGLVSVLRGADILFLPERFDETVGLISLSVSSKAHLFMFSGKPIVVYSHPITGIARYAKEEGWAAVVDNRDPQQLADVFEELITEEKAQKKLIEDAQRIALKNHHLPQIKKSFNELLWSAVQKG